MCNSTVPLFVYRLVKGLSNKRAVKADVSSLMVGHWALRHRWTLWGLVLVRCALRLVSTGFIVTRALWLYLGWYWEPVKTATLQNGHNQNGHTEWDHYQNGHTTLVKTATLLWSKRPRKLASYQNGHTVFGQNGHTLFGQNGHRAYLQWKEQIWLPKRPHCILSKRPHSLWSNYGPQMNRSGYQNGHTTIILC